MQIIAVIIITVSSTSSCSSIPQKPYLPYISLFLFITQSKIFKILVGLDYLVHKIRQFSTVLGPLQWDFYITIDEITQTVLTNMISRHEQLT